MAIDNKKQALLKKAVKKAAEKAPKKMMKDGKMMMEDSPEEAKEDGALKGFKNLKKK